jgi:hypothetical protein
MVTGPVNPAEWIVPSGRADNNRRTRIAAQVNPELRGWLQRCARVHACIATTVRMFGRPSKAGGYGLAAEGYAERIARGDKSVLYECLTFCTDELAAIREEIQKRMDATPPTHHQPGSREKVELMAERMRNGDSLFVPGDAKTELR